MLRRPVPPRGLPARTRRAVALHLARSEPGWLWAVPDPTDAQVQRVLRLDSPDDLLGVTADPWWCAIGIALPAFAAADDIAPSPGTSVALVLDRCNRSALAVRAGSEVADLDATSVWGYVADLAARILGLPSAPEAATPAALVLRVWLHNLLDAAADPDPDRPLRSWPDAVALHPLWRAAGERPLVCPPATVAQATRATSHQLPWERMRRMAADGAIVVPGLGAADAAWMDWPFFARWTLDVHRPVTSLLDDLSLFLDPPLLDDVRSTAHALGWLGFAEPVSGERQDPR